MFKKLLSAFGGAPKQPAPAPAPPRQPQPPANPAQAALLDQIARMSKDDPLIGAKIGSKEVTAKLIAAMTTEHGVHVDSLLCALGALAGYACQSAVRRTAEAMKLEPNALLTVVNTVDGKTFYFGDHLNKPLAENPYSVWSIAGGGAQEAGCTVMPDLMAIFQHVTQDVGTDQFGVPRVPEKNKAHDTPVNYLTGLWPHIKPVLPLYCPERAQWPIMLALSIQQVIVMAKDAIEPGLALTIVMESAVPMSKVDVGVI